MKVFLDPGHGGKDPGALGNGLREKDIALSVTLKVGEILKRHNIEVIYSRTTDVFLELSERTNLANKANADIFVSIHCNAAENINAKGVETFSYPNSTKGTALAKCIQDSIIQSKVYTSDRGIKTANFAVLRQSNMPSALVELAFITNVDDGKILKDRQDELALAVAKGILNYLGIKYIEKTKELDCSPWAVEAMEWGMKNNLTDGTNPKEPISLERFITILYRYGKALE
ncbi:N-acetylmuramoyl-L-alanine amidase [Tissierella pigra]|uniref:N-acetylmuramoyl-L-alanine amidase family protein n=1 Tax=Tissierella pigra TaxID=2607614 RepID=UPI001C11388A|nr:N-acetylmuramoyl-L-alanine amidase [Tissierella pigra]MBU5425027.1 N-acetylmuramoyl-L-alanine amidase [Tissierella pigra]